MKNKERIKKTVKSFGGMQMFCDFICILRDKHVEAPGNGIHDLLMDMPEDVRKLVLSSMGLACIIVYERALELHIDGKDKFEIVKK